MRIFLNTLVKNIPAANNSLIGGNKFHEVHLDAAANIRELRNAIVKIINRPWDSLDIILIINYKSKETKDLQRKGVKIFLDTPPEITLSDFMKENIDTELNIEEIGEVNCWINFFPSPERSLKPTKHNPRGFDADMGMDYTPSRFFQLIRQPEEKKRFSARLQKIGFPEADIPERFQDPATCKIMEDPVIVPDSQHVLDKSTIENYGNKNPFSKKPVDFTLEALSIRSEIEEFVTRKELIYSLLEDSNETIENQLFGSFKL